MRDAHLDHWTDFPEREMLLLFAKRLEEALFDYSLDSYKARALNTYTRCIELKHYLGEVRAASLSKNVLLPMMQELADSIRRDKVARSLLDHHAEYFGNKQDWEAADIDTIDTRVRYLISTLKDIYEKRLIAHIRDLLTGDRKKDLISATGRLAVQWKHKGFSSDYIYYNVKTFFFSDRVGPVDTVDKFDDFVELFRREPRKWRVIIRGHGNLAVLDELFDEDAPVEISEDTPATRTDRNQERNFLSKAHDGVYIVIDSIEALDARAAHTRADMELESFASIARYHVHREPFTWDGSALVYGEDDHPIRLQEPTPPIEKHPECYLDELPGEYLKTLDAVGPQKLSPESWQRLTRVLRLHSTAVESDREEGQLFSLWTALESLLPLSELDSHIHETIKSVTPLLSRSYPEKLVADLHDSLSRCLGRRYQEILGGIDEESVESEDDGCAALLILGKYEELRNDIYAACKDFPLLRHRMFRLHQMTSTSESIRAAIEKHSERVRWHLHRIYRSRNLLVHTGQVLPFRTILIENIHAYVDRIIERLEERFSREPLPGDLDEALLSISMEHRAHMDALQRHGGRELQEDTWKYLLYGPR